MIEQLLNNKSNLIRDNCFKTLLVLDASQFGSDFDIEYTSYFMDDGRKSLLWIYFIKIKR